MALSMLIGLGLGLVLARNIVGGVRDVQAMMISLADNCAKNLAQALEAPADGDLTATVTPSTRPIEHVGADEVGKTAAAASRLAAEVQNTIESYERTRQALVTTVGEVQRSAFALAETSEQVGRSRLRPARRSSR